jgi:hypothetical protein
MHKSFYFLFFLLMVLPASVAAQCGQRDVSGRWAITFGEGSTSLLMDIKQSGNAISGMARTELSNNFDFAYGDNLKGQVTGDTIDFNIRRDSPKYTVNESFQGVFGQDGRITGKALIVAFDANIKVTWSSDRPMRCLYKPITKLGVKHTDPGGAQAGVPFIVASPNNIRLAFGQTTGVTNIIWDGGPDHPYAEVWLKVDNADETKVLEQGKGTIPVQIAAGRTYKYILTDAGTTLATVTVRFLQ